MRMRPFGRLVAWTTALERARRAVRPIERTERLPVGAAVGRVTARGYRSETAVPAFDRATWDGYAFRSRSTLGATARDPARLRIVGEVYADGGFHRTVGAGQAVAIATGGALPRGVDTVVPFEEVRVTGSLLRVPRPIGRGERIARAGEDLRKGGPVVRSGVVLAPADVGALALTGHARVEVWSRPIVTIVPNGSELARPGRRLPEGRIYESNGPTLSAVVAASGGIPRIRPPVQDDPGRIEATVRAALSTSDLVLVTGGSSVGERDYLPMIFPRLGRLLFHGIAIRPGKPTLAVAVGRRLVIGMPGHPGSCLSNGYWLLVPLLRRLARLPGAGWTLRTVQLSGTVDLPESEFATVVPLEVRGKLGRPTFHDSSAISSLGGANAFAIWPPGGPRPRRGSRIEARLLLPPLGAFPSGP